MTNPNPFNDVSITEPEEDLFGIDPFAQTLAKSLGNMASPVGTTIALNGPWGSGKSSAVNLIRHHLKKTLRTTRSVSLISNVGGFVVRKR